MKKFFCILLALLLCFSLFAACDKSDNNAEGDGKGNGNNKKTTEITTAYGDTYTVNIDIFSLDVAGEYKTTLFRDSERSDIYRIEVPCTVFVTSRSVREEFEEDFIDEDEEFFYAIEFSGLTEESFFVSFSSRYYLVYDPEENFWRSPVY